MYKTEFEEIRPFYDSEINGVLQSLIKNPFFIQILNGYFPAQKHSQIIELLKNTNTAYSFQCSFMDQIINNVIQNTTSSVTSSGIEVLEKNKKYLFISNHRDIILDSAILQKILYENNFETTEIAFGSNLMYVPLIAELGRANKMFIVKRGGNLREILHNSNVLSSYIRKKVAGKLSSVWIAQRNGRTKNGDDKTEIALLKMLNLSGKKSINENIAELNIVPISISYEFETCDAEKIYEVYCSQFAKYEKNENEDTHSVIKGVTQFKGAIHLAFGKPLSEAVIKLIPSNSNAEFFKQIGQKIDEQIYKNYQLNPNNYIAYDIIFKTNSFADKYNKEQVDKFLNHKNESLSKLPDYNNEIEELFLKLYANPVINKYNLHNN